MSEQNVELIENASDAPAVTNPFAGLPTITITWDPLRGVVGLNFDDKKLGTWPLIIAALDMAKQYAKDQMEMQQMVSMQQRAAEQQEAERIRRQVARKPTCIAR